MCKEMSTGFFFLFACRVGVLWWGWGDVRGGRQFSHGEKEYLSTFYENTYLSWPFCYITLEHDLFALVQDSS